MLVIALINQLLQKSSQLQETNQMNIKEKGDYMSSLPRKIFALSLALLFVWAFVPSQISTAQSGPANRKPNRSDSRTRTIPLNLTPMRTSSPDSPEAQLIQDPGFENGSPWTAWTVQTSTNFGSSICNTSICSTNGGLTAAFAGTNWNWFGGGTGGLVEDSTTGQSVVIPSGVTASLTFQLKIQQVTTPFTDTMAVQVDGVTQQTFTEPAAGESAYTLRTINLNAFANGASHSIVLNYHSIDGASNFLIDDINLTTTVVAAASAKPFDFTGDGRADLAIYKPGTNTWQVVSAATAGSAPVISTNWGTSGDKLVPADYDADLKADIAVYRPSDGNWYIRNSSGVPSATSIINWGGAASDRPVPGDYDGDGKADVAVFRAAEGNWYVKKSGGGTSVVGWGNSTDVVVPGDYDGDKRADYAVYRPSEGNWYIRTNPAAGSPTVTNRNWGGGANDKPIPADYDNDGKTDFAIYRPSEFNFYIINSLTNSVTIKSWGLNGDVLVPADYDGDGKADIAIFRPNASGSQWWIFRSSDSTIMNNGTAGQPPTVGSGSDTPVPSAYIAAPNIP